MDLKRPQRYSPSFIGIVPIKPCDDGRYYKAKEMDEYIAALEHLLAIAESDSQSYRELHQIIKDSEWLSRKRLSACELSLKRMTILCGGLALVTLIQGVFLWS